MSATKTGVEFFWNPFNISLVSTKILSAKQSARGTEARTTKIKASDRKTISASLVSILFPETRAIARARAGTHTSKFTCAIYRTREIIAFSRKEKFFIEGFSIEHNYKIL